MATGRRRSFILRLSGGVEGGVVTKAPLLVRREIAQSNRGQAIAVGNEERASIDGTHLHFLVSSGAHR